MENYHQTFQKKEKSNSLYIKKYKKYYKKWNKISLNFKESLKTYNTQKYKFTEELLLLYEIITAKLIEDFVFFEDKENLDLKLKTKNYVDYKWERNKFKEFYYDYVLGFIKHSYKRIYEGDFNLIKKNRILKKKIGEGDLVDIHKFVLMMLKTNNICLTEKKLKKLRNNILRFSKNKEYFEFIISYLTLFILLKDKTVFFNEFIVELFEDMIIYNVSQYLEDEKQNYECIYNLGLICYEMYCCYLIKGEDYFSNRFLKIFRSFKFWYSFDFWNDFFNYLRKIFSNNKNGLYFTNMTKNKTKKKKIKNMINIFEIITFIGFYFLKMPFEKLFDIINEINEKNNLISPNAIFTLSKKLEVNIIKNYKQKKSSKKNRNKINTTKKLQIILKKTIKYFSATDPTLSNLIKINKNTYKHLKKKILKNILKLDSLERKKRIKIWEEIAKHEKQINPNFSKTVPIALEEKILHVLKMDVKRTNFVKKNKKKLINLLITVSSNFPSTSYYQGMNCIGGFLINYIDNFEKSLLIFEYIMKCRLEKYLLNNFSCLKKLFFIAEKLLERFSPKLHEHLKFLEIGNEFFISPIILTIFCSGLQFIENYNLVAKIMDIFLIDGWVGFFKVFLYVFSVIEKKLLDMDYDVILEFLNKNLYEKLFYLNLDKFKSNCFKVCVSKEMILEIENEYDKTRRVVDEYWNKHYDEKRRVVFS